MLPKTIFPYQEIATIAIILMAVLIAQRIDNKKGSNNKSFTLIGKKFLPKINSNIEMIAGILVSL